ncbi:hypothetical protein ACFVJ8_30115 [Streptomyces yangpuensis]|uniref:hypothetical protein n=1 Tax=Streptomyces yangpuensis TaxID=1648182 RepID=UPI00363D7C13
MLTDRDERALLAAAENRLSRPLRIGAVLTSVRRAFARRPQDRDRMQERESVACQPPRTPMRP